MHVYTASAGAANAAHVCGPACSLVLQSRRGSLNGVRLTERCWTVPRSKQYRRAVQVHAINTPTKAAEAAATAAVAVAEISKAVRMRGVEAPDAQKTYVALGDDRKGLVDEAGLPLVYDKELIQKYWDSQGSALQQRWTEFLGQSVPFLTRIATMMLTGGNEELQRNERSLARQAREIMEKLGPTYIKAGQMMSVRPDVLPQAALDELAILQDSVKPFETSVAIATIEQELGVPLGAVFSDISEEPVAAASLAQVYRAVIRETGQTVAIKVQRPGVQELVSKDLYVLRRAAEVYQGLVERFAPQQRTDYVALLNEWAVGFYTELDFQNEMKNQQRIKQLLIDENVKGVYVPEVYPDYTTRRILVTEWVDGVKLSQCSPEEIRELISIGQEAFLIQLLQVGFFHSDPHPGNLLKMSDTAKGQICLLDFGLVAEVEQKDMDTMVSSVVHLANKDYASLVDDFIDLGILPPDTDRAKVEPLMDKALTPYVKGGGAKKYEEEIRRMYGLNDGAGAAVGGFQAMTQDVLTVLNDIPFTVPPYFALLARAVVTLEGIALIGDPDFKLVMECYPFVARKLLSEDRPEIQKALVELLYTSPQGGNLFEGPRLRSLVNSAMGAVAKTDGVFVDLDALPEEGVTLAEALKFLASDKSKSLRVLLESEAENAVDLLARQGIRKNASVIFTSSLLNPPSFLPSELTSFLPKAQSIAHPMLLPIVPQSSRAALSPTSTTMVNDLTLSDLQLAPAMSTWEEVVEAAAPRLTREEELYALSLTDLVASTAGKDISTIVAGDAITESASLVRVVASALRSPQIIGDSQAAQFVRQLLPDDGQGMVASSFVSSFVESTSVVEGPPGGVEMHDTLDADAFLEQWVGALDELDDVEKQTLTQTATRILQRVALRTVARLEPLVMQSN